MDCPIDSYILRREYLIIKFIQSLILKIFHIYKMAIFMHYSCISLE